MHIHWPQGILLGWFTIALVTAAAHDDEPLPHPTYKFGLALLRVALFIGLLYWGGFFA